MQINHLLPKDISTEDSYLLLVTYYANINPYRKLFFCYILPDNIPIPQSLPEREIQGVR